jgi:hypothetical protein
LLLVFGDARHIFEQLPERANNYDANIMKSVTRNDLSLCAIDEIKLNMMMMDE